MLAGAGESTVEVHGFRDGYLPTMAAAVKDAFEELKSQATPSWYSPTRGTTFIRIIGLCASSPGTRSGTT